MIVATQKPSDNVISTNLPAQLALRINNSSKSRAISDGTGPKVLNGKGEAFLKADKKLVRIQCARVSSFYQ